MSGPFRDENDTLRAENARLRARLAKRNGTRRGITWLLTVSIFGAVVLLRPWLNGESDAKFWGALVIVGGIALAAILSVLPFRQA